MSIARDENQTSGPRAFGRGAIQPRVNLLALIVSLSIAPFAATQARADSGAANASGRNRGRDRPEKCRAATGPAGTRQDSTDHHGASCSHAAALHRNSSQGAYCTAFTQAVCSSRWHCQKLPEYPGTVALRAGER